MTNLFLLPEDGKWGQGECEYSHFPLNLSHSTQRWASNQRLQELQYPRHPNFHLSHNIVIFDNKEKMKRREIWEEIKQRGGAGGK